jgi:putative transposase
MIKSYKYRIYPNDYQRHLLLNNFGACRFIFNKALALKNQRYEQYGDNLGVYEIAKMITFWKKTEELKWLKQASISTLQQELLHLDSAYKKFFKGQGFPKFKKKSNYQTITAPTGIRVDKNKIKFPKLGLLKTSGLREMEGKLKSGTITKTLTNKYFISLNVDDRKKLPKLKKGKKVTGIDLGLTNFMTLSDGTKIDNPKLSKAYQHRLTHLQRKLSKCQIGSKNRDKARLQLALLNEKIVNKRKDFLHKLSTKLVRENQANIFKVEKLNVEGMKQNHHLAGVISDASWSEFIRMLKYKALWNGKQVIQVDTFFPSSKLCSKCGVKNTKLTLNDRTWTCKCGQEHDRDINAAINLKNCTDRLSGSKACGEYSLEIRRSKKSLKGR